MEFGRCRAEGYSVPKTEPAEDRLAIHLSGWAAIASGNQKKMAQACITPFRRVKVSGARRRQGLVLEDKPRGRGYPGSGSRPRSAEAQPVTRRGG